MHSQSALLEDVPVHGRGEPELYLSCHLCTDRMHSMRRLCGCEEGGGGKCEEMSLSERCEVGGM